MSRILHASRYHPKIADVFLRVEFQKQSREVAVSVISSSYTIFSKR